MSGYEWIPAAIGAAGSAYAATRPLPKPQELPKAPTVDQSTVDREAQDLAMRRRGRAATVLAGDASAPAGSVAVKQLLGG